MIEFAKIERERRSESEKEMLGAMMFDIDGSVIDSIVEFVSPEMIVDEACQEAFRAIVQCRRDGEPTTADVLFRKVDTAKCTVEALLEMAGAVPHSSHGEYYARSVVEAWRIRKASEFVRDALESLRMPTVPVVDTLRVMASGIEKAADGCVAEKHESFAQLLEQLTKNEDDLGVITTGISTLDRLLSGGGFKPKQLVCVGARPSVGKTSLLTGFALAAARNGTPSLVLSFEMDSLQIARRIVSQGNLRLDDDLDRERAGTLPIHIRDCAGWTMERIEAAVRKSVRTEGVRLVAVDYLGLIEAPRVKGRDFQQRWQQIGDITRAMKRLAMGETVSIVLAQQFNRSVEARSTRRPLMSDFRESGSIEQDADILIGLDREIRPDQEETPDRGMLYVMKQRNGSTGDVPVSYDCERTLFKDLEVPTWRD